MPITRALYAIALSVALSACGSSSDKDPPAVVSVETPLTTLKLKSFSGAGGVGCAELLDYAAAALSEQYLNLNYGCGIGVVAGCGTTGGGSPVPADGAVPDRVSEPQQQEAGVDEADVLKTGSDGTLYIVDGHRLYILDAFPPAGLQGAALAAIDLRDGDPNFYASELFLDEAANKLVVLGSSYAAAASATVTVIVDISNPAQPVITQRLRHDGYPLQARRIGSRVHRVSHFSPAMPNWFYDGGDTLVAQRRKYAAAYERGNQAAQDTIKSATRSVIRQRLQNGGAATALLPRLSDAAGIRTLGCADLARPALSADYGLVIIDSFDTDGGNRATTAAINSSYLVYASTRNLYLAQSSFGWHFDRGQLEETALYRFTLSASGPAVYQGVGKVAGSVSSRFSLGEHQGHLRVTSTETRTAADTASRVNHLHVLRADQPLTDMAIVGSVKNFAPGEIIQSARFVGKRGYVVTFRQIDPLFAFDLEQPTQPRIVSELKIPGFSRYIAPLGEDYLLTVGREGDGDGLTGRMQISLFDVRDLAAVSQIATLVPSGQPGNYSYSEAEYDSHAFTYFSDSADHPIPGRLAVPLQVYGAGPEQRFSGVVLAAVNPAADSPAQRLHELGRVDHSTLAVTRVCAGFEFCYDATYAADPRRSVFMQDAQGSYLYTISTAGVIASLANDPAQELGRRELPFAPPYYGCCIGLPIN